ncbi:MAG: hypothetical protein OEV64_15060 [Desulfobulbaceae bacterium]|nr:hypothetical protein [Desulfobulbaceae bacterium]
MIQIKILVVVFLFICTNATCSLGDTTSVYGELYSADYAFSEIIKKTTKHKRVDISTIDQITPYLHRVRFSEGLNGIITLWQAGYREPVELAWWRSPYRTTRLLVLCLFYITYSDQDIDIFPKFKEHANRFNEREQLLRLEEINYVIANISNIKEKLEFTLPASNKGAEGKID